MTNIEKDYLNMCKQRISLQEPLKLMKLKRVKDEENMIREKSFENANYLKNKMLQTLNSFIGIVENSGDTFEGGAYTEASKNLYKKANAYTLNLYKKRALENGATPTGMTNENVLTQDEAGKEQEMTDLLLKVETSISNIHLTSNIVSNMNELYQLIVKYAYVIKYEEVDNYINAVVKIRRFLQEQFVKKYVNKKELQIADTIITICEDIEPILENMKQYPNASISEKRIIIQQEKMMLNKSLGSKFDERMGEQKLQKQIRNNAKDTINKKILEVVRSRDIRAPVEPVDVTATEAEINDPNLLFTKPYAGESKEKKSNRVAKQRFFQDALNELLLVKDDYATEQDFMKDVIIKTKQSYNDYLKDQMAQRREETNKAIDEEINPDIQYALRLDANLKKSKAALMTSARHEATKRIESEGLFRNEKHKQSLIDALTKTIYHKNYKILLQTIQSKKEAVKEAANAELTQQPMQELQSMKDALRNLEEQYAADLPAMKQRILEIGNKIAENKLLGTAIQTKKQEIEAKNKNDIKDYDAYVKTESKNRTDAYMDDPASAASIELAMKRSKWSLKQVRESYFDKTKKTILSQTRRPVIHIFKEVSEAEKQEIKDKDRPVEFVTNKLSILENNFHRGDINEDILIEHTIPLLQALLYAIQIENAHLLRLKRFPTLEEERKRIMQTYARDLKSRQMPQGTMEAAAAVSEPVPVPEVAPKTGFLSSAAHSFGSIFSSSKKPPGLDIIPTSVPAPAHAHAHAPARAPASATPQLQLPLQLPLQATATATSHPTSVLPTLTPEMARQFATPASSTAQPSTIFEIGFNPAGHGEGEGKDETQPPVEAEPEIAQARKKPVPKPVVGYTTPLLKRVSSSTDTFNAANPDSFVINSTKIPVDVKNFNKYFENIVWPNKALLDKMTKACNYKPRTLKMETVRNACRIKLYEM